MTLTDFLLARIAEDEAIARAARHEPGKGWSWASVEFNSDVAANHGYQFDPSRVLAECEAKRQIVEEHKLIRAAYPGTTVETDPCCSTCSAGGEYPGDGFPCPTLRAIAAVYADHPDFQEHWTHKWPAHQPALEPWTCYHDCHGPEGLTIYPVVLGSAT